ncbi:MAG: hypothetical protein IE887_02055 [Campylobacterales bacterium]|nr:hypothetical protein [Campylobacterales bacterium]
MYDVDNDERVYVITYKELLFTLIVFAIILFALYPKGILKDRIAADTSNYDLSMIYLKDLLKHNPNDEALQLLLLEKNVLAGKVDSSLELSQKLRGSQNNYIRDKATVLSFELEKAKYFTAQDTQKQKILFSDLKRLFRTIYMKKLYDDNVQKWYDNAVLVEHHSAAYHFLQKLLKEDPTNVVFLRDGYHLSLYLNKKVDSIQFIDALKRYDTNNSLEWTMNKYDIFIRYKDYKSAEIFLQQYANESIYIQKKLADFYLMIQRYEDASDAYLKLYYSSLNKQEQEKYLIKAIKSLQSGNLLKQAANLVHQYESKYVGNLKMRKFFLKIYLAAEELDYAAKFSKQILKYENRL